ncbi:benzoate/H(+) symporter BenE family transporter [Vibrio sp. Y2-5]|uniref:benzoate/H(+) symporter BenE family transporter n=1 Tax=Vibrio TaxID=662 RepID=UPI00142DD3C0|nr:MULTISPECIES: benzoate/H(+) symporter BenE family transporter [Vibrio]MBD0786489.1 benzoate/H(+) symporter BenE family transporter [Vibrio sp. Y2-5]NIY91940.1 benzoate/H(+) symporter BenE family transporter [Vibrio diazotrophicus]
MQKGRFNLSHVSAGFTAVLVGYTSSVVIIIQAATAVGATSVEIESWLLALGLAMGITSILFSWYFKKPILTAWSTPGAAMLVAAVGQYEMSVVLGAFVISGLLIVLTGLISPLSRALANIPPQLATAMLGAILLSFCVKTFSPVMTDPTIFFCMFAAFLAGKRFLPQYTMAILLIVGIVYSITSGAFDKQSIDLTFAKPVWITPSFNITAMINLSFPLYIITMLSQNLPGIAMMRSHSYDVPVKPLLLGSGIANMLFAPFGGFSVNLAAISAAICMNKDVDEDPSQRYRAVIWAGVFYLVAGIWATTVVATFLALPKEVTQILAGLALLGTLLMCFQTAFKEENVRESALYTFLITLSGVTFLGIGSVVWGLVVGLLHLHFIARKV